MDFMGSCRHSAPHITLIPREPCLPAVPAVWFLPSRTTWSPHPWARLALMFSTEPSQLTRALQCMICLQVLQASSESLFAVDLKTPPSCKSVLWTAVLASSALSILKAKGSPGFHYHWHPGPFCRLSRFVFMLSKDCMRRMSTKSAEPTKSQMCLWRAGMDSQSWAWQECLQLLLFLSGFAGHQDCHCKGNLDSLYRIPVTSWLSTLKGHR